MFAKKSPPPEKATASEQGLRAFADARAPYMVAAHNWRLFAWGCLIVAILASSIAFMHEREPREVPYVVSMNPQNGDITNLGTAQPLSQDQRAEIVITQYVLRQFIQNWRMVVPAPDFQAKMIADYVEPFIVSNSPASNMIATFYKAADPYTRMKNYVVDVTIDQPVPETSTTYELHWIETTRTRLGTPVQTSEWRGFATISYHASDPSSVVLNPAGITIDSLTVQEVGSPNNAPTSHP